MSHALLLEVPGAKRAADPVGHLWLVLHGFQSSLVLVNSQSVGLFVGPVNSSDPFQGSVARCPDDPLSATGQSQKFAHRQGFHQRVCEAHAPFGSIVHQEALRFDRFPKPSSSVPRSLAIPSGVGGPNKALVAESKGRRAGITVNQNCWLPLSSCTNFSGTFVFPKSNSGKCNNRKPFRA